MSDLIRREDALRVTLAYSSSYSAEQAETAIRALPAAQPDADKLVGHMTKLIAVGLDRIEALTAERDRLRAALIELIQQTHNCERELTEDLHHVDFCGESVPLTNAREALKGETP